MAVDDVNQSALIDEDIVRLWRRTATRGIGNKEPNLARCGRLRQIDNAQSRAEPYGMNDRARRPLMELMRAEARAGRTRERRIQFTHVEQGKRSHVIACHVIRRHARM